LIINEEQTLFRLVVSQCRIRIGVYVYDISSVNVSTSMSCPCFIVDYVKIESKVLM